MPDIKTRDIAKGTIKTIDKSAVAAERMKSAFIQTKEKAEHSATVPESSMEEYASNRLESGIDKVSHEAVHQFDKQGRKGVQATKQNIVKAKDGIQKFKETVSYTHLDVYKRQVSHCGRLRSSAACSLRLCHSCSL